MKKKDGIKTIDVKKNMQWPEQPKCANVELVQLCEDEDCAKPVGAQS